MAKKPKIEVDDEPGAEGRFMRGIRKALKTPHKPHSDEATKRTRLRSAEKKTDDRSNR